MSDATGEPAQVANGSWLSVVGLLCSGDDVSDSERMASEPKRRIGIYELRILDQPPTY
ncbi:hypothetical protein [Candidatus Lucifugimonas marina]|uniref:Uncharacterized protein n=1 Tax=Candidatus Lucifugimonas marina TaxID=3038979 RepID=A0AAJ6CST6_9CHLR|nr:hypothetical protein [SAR202 cluster bacterium JH702]WFG38707.1 hypothetical protein GKO48_03500 [SAR202 cluster bacterium JH1073]